MGSTEEPYDGAGCDSAPVVDSEMESARQQQQAVMQDLLHLAAEQVLLSLSPYGRDVVSLKGPSLKPTLAITQKLQHDSQFKCIASAKVREALCQLLQSIAMGWVPPEQLCLAWSIAMGFYATLPDEDAHSVFQKCVSLTRNMNILELNLGNTMQSVVKNPLQFMLGFWGAFLKTAMPMSEANHVQLLDFLRDVCCQNSRIACEAFRVLQIWLLHFETGCPISRKHADAVFDLISCNWEHPISGVRREISKALTTLLDIRAQGPYTHPVTFVKYILETQSWSMKSKYYCLAAAVPKCNLQTFNLEPIAEGLVKCLTFNHLLNPGCDLYQACLTIIPDVETWNSLFSKPFAVAYGKDEIDISQQNLVSHWLPITMRHFPGITPYLLKLHIDSYKESRGLLYLAALIHGGFKEGSFDEQWEEDILGKFGESMWNPDFVRDTVKRLLAHANSAVRKHAFAAVCKRTKTSILPSEDRIETVKQFLIENVNTSDSPLRQSIINSFSHFLKQLHDSAFKSLSMKDDCACVLNFFAWLHKFLICNLQLGSNYQRRITSLQLYLEVLQAFGPGETLHQETASQVRSAVAVAHGAWMFASEESWQCMFTCVCDPTDDIQKGAAEILTKYLSKETTEDVQGRRANALFGKALALCSSPLFYEAESAAIIVQILIQLPGHRLLSAARASQQESTGWSDNVSHEKSERKKPEFELKSGLFLVDELLRLTLAQWSAVQEDFYQATVSDSPLHGVLGALRLLVPYFSQQCSQNLLHLMNNIVDFYLSQLSSSGCDDSVSPSFAEMTEAIENIIPSSFQGREGELSPSHQLLLNCLWLSIRACCSLACALACSKKTDGEVAAQCFYLVRKVLMQCRHKGAIEAAGVSLSAMVRHVTSETEKRKYTFRCEVYPLQDLPGFMLRAVLKDLGQRAARTSVTRRSAGIGIFVHRIVAADTRSSKPLLHNCISTLLERINSEKEIEKKSSSHTTDLPQSSALHLLCRLVQDSSLRQDVTVHASLIACKCLRTINSPVWTIKNAALQLFGALVPLLIGEKKMSDDDEEEFAFITAEEFLCRHSNIGRLLIELLDSAGSLAVYQRHSPDPQEFSSHVVSSSNAVPILSFLSKLTLGRMPQQMAHVTEMIELIRSCIHNYCSSPSAEVRHIASKAKARFVGFRDLRDQIREHIHKLSRVSEIADDMNYTEGLLQTLKYLVVWYLKEVGDIKGEKSTLVKDIQSIKMLREHWMNHLRFTELKQIVQSHEGEYKDDLLKIVKAYRNSSGISIGLKQCLLAETARVLMVCPPEKLDDAWSILERCECPAIDEVFFRVVNENILHCEYVENRQLVCSLQKVLLSEKSPEERKEAASHTLLLLLRLSKQNVTDDLSMEIYHLHATKNHTSPIWSVALPVICGLFWTYCLNSSVRARQNVFDFEFYKSLVNHVYERSVVTHCEAQVKVHGACAFVFLYKVSVHCIQNLNAEDQRSDYENVVVKLLDSGIAYLQDEDMNVREEAARISKRPENSYRCLLRLLSVMGLKDLLTEEQACRYLFGKLTDFKVYEEVLTELQKSPYDDFAVTVSPFDHGTTNFFAEERHVLERICEELLLFSSHKKIENVRIQWPYAAVHSLVSGLLECFRRVKKVQFSLEIKLQCLVVQLQGISQLSQRINITGSTKEFADLAEKIAAYTKFQTV